MARKMRYIAIIGSRIAAREDVLNAIKSLKLSPKHHVIVSGGCKSGADKWAKDIAEEWGFQYLEAVAFWSRGKHAGMDRNTTIIDISDAVVAVWDGHSPGTRDSVDKAKAAGKKLEIFLPLHGIAAVEEAEPKKRPKGIENVATDE